MERRKFARIQVGMKLKFKNLESFEGMVTGSAGDLSLSGMYIHTKQTKEVGSRVAVELPVPGQEPISIQGTVRSIRCEEGKDCGMGIEFDKLAEPALGVIQYLIKKHENDS